MKPGSAQGRDIAGRFRPPRRTGARSIIDRFWLPTKHGLATPDRSTEVEAGHITRLARATGERGNRPPNIVFVKQQLVRRVCSHRCSTSHERSISDVSWALVFSWSH